MLTLGIETSCDETSCAVLKDRDELLSNVISSSLFRHQPFGGVVPEIASRHCLEQIDGVLRAALSQARVRLQDIQLIAVTQGPGLIGSLFVGIAFAKVLAYQLGIPLVAVNHLEAHLVANFIGRQEPDSYVGLLISGGHTSLSYHAKGNVLLLGETVDDAVGEAFDKVAKLLGLGYPGGPVIERLAKEGNAEMYSFTHPRQKNRFDFSFSGIKTAVRYLIENLQFPKMKGEGIPGNPRGAVPLSIGSLPPSVVRDIAASFQKTVTAWLVDKALAAAEFKGAKHIVVGGGVSANRFLRDALIHAGKEKGILVLFPEKTLSLDNAGMICRRGWELYQAGIRATFSLTAYADLPIKTLSKES